MTLTVKDWQDSPSTTTPLSAAALEDLETRLGAYTDTQVATRAATSHTHAAADIASGTVATARLGSGTASSTTYLRGDQTWATVAAGGVQVYDTKVTKTRPTGAIAETFSRLQGITNGTSALSSGVLRCSSLMYFPSGQAVSSLTAISGGTAVGTPTNQWFCVIRQSDLTVLAVTVDDTTAAWATNTAKTLSITGGWTPSQDEWCYFGVMVAATTVPSLCAQTFNTANAAGLGNPVCFSSTTGLTTPITAGSTITVGSATTNNAYGYAS